jgi:hypothetical protein
LSKNVDSKGKETIKEEEPKPLISKNPYYYITTKRNFEEVLDKLYKDMSARIETWSEEHPESNWIIKSWKTLSADVLRLITQRPVPISNPGKIRKF